MVSNDLKLSKAIHLNKYATTAGCLLIILTFFPLQIMRQSALDINISKLIFRRNSVPTECGILYYRIQYSAEFRKNGILNSCGIPEQNSLKFLRNFVTRVTSGRLYFLHLTNYNAYLT